MSNMQKCITLRSMIRATSLFVFVSIGVIFIQSGSKGFVIFKSQQIEDLQYRKQKYSENSDRKTPLSVKAYDDEVYIQPEKLSDEYKIKRKKHKANEERDIEFNKDNEDNGNNISKAKKKFEGLENDAFRAKYENDNTGYESKGAVGITNPTVNDFRVNSEKSAESQQKITNESNKQQTYKIIDSIPQAISRDVNKIRKDLNPRLLTTLPPDTDSLSTFIPFEPDTSPAQQPAHIPKRFLIEEADYCQRNPNLQVISYVHSSAERVKNRMETRNTWGNASQYDMGPMSVRIGVVFMVGRAKNKEEQKIIDDESKKYHDIVQGDYGDHYRLLSYKGLAALYWINKHCPHVPWTLHSDDDTYIDIFLYHQALQHLDEKSKQNFICSHMYGPALRTGRYKVTYEEYPMKDYPLYCSGGVWFLQTSLISRLLEARKTVPFLWVDDAYITGLLAKRAGIGQHPFQQYYGGPEVDKSKIGKELVWFVKEAPRIVWWQNIVDYHKNNSMQHPATLPLS